VHQKSFWVLLNPNEWIEISSRSHYSHLFMHEPIVIYHNPRCSKSRQALEILREHKIELHVIEYLKNPPDAKTLKELLKKLRLRARDIVRDGEDEFAVLQIPNDASDEEWIAAIVKHPILLQRPVVIRGNQAVIGRPPEKVMELL